MKLYKKYGLLLKKKFKRFVQVNRGYRFQFQIKIDNPC